MENEVVKFKVDDKEIKFYLPDLEDHVQKTISQLGDFYEREMLDDIRTHVSPGSLAIDVGANIGNHTIYLSCICGMKVFAFEPYRPCFDMLLRNIEINDVEGEVTAIQKAVGSVSGRGNPVVVSSQNLGQTKVVLY